MKTTTMYYFQPSWKIMKSVLLFLTRNHRMTWTKWTPMTRNAKRFNDAIITEVNGMKNKDVFVNTTRVELDIDN
jgi:hypothetical protein